MWRLFFFSTVSLYFSFFFSGCVLQNTRFITYSTDIAPLIYKNCTPCHRNNNAGPFNLISYNEVKSKAGLIAYAVKSRYMPPWPADVSYRHFAGEKYLTDSEIKLIVEWVEEGMMVGDSNAIPLPPLFSDSNNFGTPDLVLKMPEKVLLPGNLNDQFMVMKLPYELPQDTFIKLIEFVPGNKKLLHHMNAHLVQYDESEKKVNTRVGEWMVKQDIYDSHEIHKKLGLLYDDESYPRLVPSVCNYLPGVETNIFPDGIGGYKIRKKGALYLNDIHYGPTARDQEDLSYFNIYFDREAPKRPIREFQMGTLGVSPVIPPLSIAPDSIQIFKSILKLEEDISLVTVTPHMHLIGKSFLAFAVDRSGDTIPIIKIPKWDFRWQYFYKFTKMLKIEAGSTIYVEGVFDNTSQNPNNPFYPPQRIIERNGSMRTTDEMFQLIIQYVKYQSGDENKSLQ